jgi:type II secretory pathway component PulC
MSLINDALKRAQEAQRKDNPAYIVSPMRPNAPAPTPTRIPTPRRKQRNLSWFMPVVIILLVLVAVFFMVMAMAKRTVKNIVAAPEIATPSQVETAVVPAPTPPAPVEVAAPEVIGPAAIAADVPKPVIILQGVVNDPKHPWAIVNGKTVYLGDNVEGMRVTTISRSSITLIGNGQTNIVYVGQ